MSHFINSALRDIRSGRESWRVVVFFTVPTFLATIVSVGVINPPSW